MTTFVRVATVSDIPAGGRRLVFVEGKSYVLFDVGGNVHALENSCPHGGASLFNGKLDGAIVTCPAHGLRFDVRTGRMPGVDGLCATTCPVEVIDGEISIGID